MPRHPVSKAGDAQTDNLITRLVVPRHSTRKAGKSCVLPSCPFSFTSLSVAAYAFVFLSVSLLSTLRLHI